MTQETSGRVLGALFVLFAVLILIAERTPPILAGLCLLAAGTAVLAARGTGRAPRSAAWLRFECRLPLAALAFLCVWMLASTLWSIAGDEALGRGLRVALMIAVAAALPVLAVSLTDAARRPAARGALIAAALAIVLLLVETLLDMPILRGFRYLAHGEVFGIPPPAEARVPGITYMHDLALANRLSHLAAVVALLAVPLAAALWQAGRRAGAAGALAGAALALAGAPTGAPLAALVAGSAAAALALLPRKAGPVAAMAAGLAMAAMPLAAERAAPPVMAVADDVLDVSALHRLGIWSNTAALIAERPLAGYGMEASRVIGREGARLDGIAPESGIDFFAMPLHPHNASLQVWLELGAPGAILFAVFGGALVWLAFALPAGRAGRAGALGCVFAGLAIAHLSFGVWQFWWVAVLGICAACAVLLQREGAA